MLTLTAKLALIVLSFMAGLLYLPAARPKKLPYRGLTVLLLGNGPSLTRDLPTLNRGDYDEIVAVNAMAKTTLFNDIRPTVYFLQDRYWFDESKQMSNKRQATLSGLKAATWKMDIYYPKGYSHAPFIKNLAENPNLNLHPLGQYRLESGLLSPNFVSGLGKKLIRFVFWMWDLQVATVPSTGVVSNALFEMLKCRAKSVHLVGVDMSMATDLKVDKNEGKSVFEPTHFYSGVRGDGISKEFRTGDFYAYISSKFQTFDIISLYAERVGCEVINRGGESLLDSFP